MSLYSERQSLRRVLRLLSAHRLAVGLALAAMAAASAGLLVLPLLVRGVLEQAAYAEPPALWQIAAMTAVLTALAICAYFSSVLLHEVARKVCARLRSDYVARWLRSSMSAHRSVPPAMTSTSARMLPRLPLMKRSTSVSELFNRSAYSPGGTLR